MPRLVSILQKLRDNSADKLYDKLLEKDEGNNRVASIKAEQGANPYQDAFQ